MHEGSGFIVIVDHTLSLSSVSRLMLPQSI